MLKGITTAINIKSKENSCKKIFCVFTDKLRSDSASSFSRVIRNWFVMPIKKPSTTKINNDFTKICWAKQS